jgi:hypothetical protein
VKKIMMNNLNIKDSLMLFLSIGMITIGLLELGLWPYVLMAMTFLLGMMVPSKRLCSRCGEHKILCCKL